MMNMHLLNRSGLAAIAAATAFLSTPVLAQDTAPAEAAPIVADTPVAAEPAATPEASTPAPTVIVPEKTARTVKSTATVAHKTSAPVAAPVKAVAATPVAATPSAAKPTVAPTAQPAPVVPVAPVDATPVETAQPAATTTNNDLLPIAGIAGLGLLALGGAAFAFRRRRRDDALEAEETWVEPEAMAAEPVVEAPVAPVAAAPVVAAPVVAERAPTAPISAFAWGKPAAPTEAVAAPVARAIPAPAPSGMSRIEAAKRGPTPDNPSASLKKRLARAAFFDQRDRQVAAGKAEPIDAMAGLPDALEPVEQAKPARRATPALDMGFNRRFQPA